MDLFKNRQDKLRGPFLLLQDLIQSPVQIDKSQLLLQPVAEMLIDNGLIQKVDVMVKIIAQFLYGIDIRADIFNLIRQGCLFYLTQNISSQNLHSPLP